MLPLLIYSQLTAVGLGYILIALPMTTNFSVSFASNPSMQSICSLGLFPKLQMIVFFPPVTLNSLSYFEKLLILKTMKRDNKTRKDCALIVNRCSSWEHWPHMQQSCFLMICSTLIFNRKQGQEMCIGLGMLGYILFAYIWTNQSRNSAAGWICFGPGLINPGPSRTQTNFLVDNKQILSQQVAQLRIDRLWMLLKCCRKVKRKSTHKHNTL